jgi:hypothetical protein
MLYVYLINFIPLPESIFNHDTTILDIIPNEHHRFESVYLVATAVNPNC